MRNVSVADANSPPPTSWLPTPFPRGVMAWTLVYAFLVCVDVETELDVAVT